MTAHANSRSRGITASPSSGEDIFTLVELETLAARASTLEERLSGQFVPKKARENIALAKNRFNAWVKSLPGEDPFLMSDILADRKIDPSKAELLFGEVELDCGHSLPEWTGIFNQLIGAPENKEHAGEKPSSAAKNLFSYEQIFYPLVEKARHMRDVKAKDIWLQKLSSEALSNLDFALLEPLSDCCIKATDSTTKNQIFEAGDGSSFPFNQKKSSHIGGSSEEKIAIQVIRDEGIKSFFYTRPVLA